MVFLTTCVESLMKFVVSDGNRVPGQALRFLKARRLSVPDAERFIVIYTKEGKATVVSCCACTVNGPIATLSALACRKKYMGGNLIGSMILFLIEYLKTSTDLATLECSPELDSSLFKMLLTNHLGFSAEGDDIVYSLRERIGWNGGGDTADDPIDVDAEDEGEAQPRDMYRGENLDGIMRSFVQQWMPWTSGLHRRFRRNARRGDNARVLAELVIDDLRLKPPRGVTGKDFLRGARMALMRAIVKTPMPKGGGLPDPQLNGRYIVGERLGKGGFGVVFKALDTNEWKFVAIKRATTVSEAEAAADAEGAILVRSTTKSSPSMDFLNEVRYAMQVSRHPSFADLLHVYADPPQSRNFNLVLQYFSDGDMRRYLDEVNMDLEREMTHGDPLTAIRKMNKYLLRMVRMMVQITNGVLFLHRDRYLVHSDLKPANVLVGRNSHGEPVAKITDLGSAWIDRLDMESRGVTAVPSMDDAIPVDLGDDLTGVEAEVPRTSPFGGTSPPRPQIPGQYPVPPVLRPFDAPMPRYPLLTPGTGGYRSPERRTGKIRYRNEPPLFSYPADIWSLGVIMLEFMLSPMGYYPDDWQFTSFKVEDMEVPNDRHRRAKAVRRTKFYEAWLADSFSKLPASMPRQLVQIARTMLQFDPAARMPADQHLAALRGLLAAGPPGMGLTELNDWLATNKDPKIAAVQRQITHLPRKIYISRPGPHRKSDGN